MTRNLKALGLALLAVFATSAMVAQAASAEEHEFTVTKAPAVLTGTSTVDHTFTAGESEVPVTCHAFLQGTQKEEVQDHVTVFPEYTECDIPIFGGIEATVENTGCTYTFDSDTVVNHAPVSILCGHGESSITIEDEFGFCEIYFSDTHPGGVEGEKTINQNLVGVVYENQTSKETPHDVHVTATVTGITYIATGGGCELLGVETGTHKDGVYEGEATVKAYEDKDDPETLHVYEHKDVDVGATVQLRE